MSEPTLLLAHGRERRPGRETALYECRDCGTTPDVDCPCRGETVV